MRALLVVSALAASVSAGAATLDRIAAVVNDEVIALSEVWDLGGSYIEERCANLANTQCVTRAEKEILESLIGQALIEQELDELGMAVTAAELERTLEQIQQDNGITDRAVFRRAVESQGIAWDDYREQLTQQIRSMKFNEVVLRPRVVVTDDEIRDRYNRSVRAFDTPPVFSLGALGMKLPEGGGQEALIEAVGQARALAARINAGELSWADALAEYDAGVFSTKEDGFIGEFRKGEALPALEDAALAVEVGSVTEPVIVGDQVLLVKLLSYKESDVRSLEEARGDISARLYEEKIDEEMELWLQQARRGATVRILLEE